LRYWDSSALVALHVQQTATSTVRDLLAQDTQVLTWILSDVEIRSALHRLSRDGAMTERQATTAIAAVESFWETIHVVSLVLPVKARAKRLLAVHPIRAADALQLGAALTAVYDDPLSHEFVCLDERLAAAARREGFSILP
jgi:uncharacterized protein